MPSSESLGQRIRTLRLQLGMSQAQLAHPELSDSYVSLIESDKRRPTPQVVRILAEKLSCSERYLLSGVTSEDLAALEERLTRAWRALRRGDPGAREEFRALLDHPAADGLAGLTVSARLGHAASLEAAGRLDDAVCELTALAVRADPDADEQNWALVNAALCRCLRIQGRLAESVAVADQALARLIARHPRWTGEMIELACALLDAYRERRDLARGRRLAWTLLTRVRGGRGDSSSAGPVADRPRLLAYRAVARFAALQGRHEEALDLLAEALDSSSAGQTPEVIAWLRRDRVELLLRRNPPPVDRALDELTRAERELAHDEPPAAEIAEHHILRARVLMIAGSATIARAAADQALESITPGRPLTRARALIVAGHARATHNRSADALPLLVEAERLLAATTPSHVAASAWCELADAYEAAGEEPAGTRALRAALTCLGL